MRSINLPVKDRPWLVPAAIEYIEKTIKRDGLAFETGAGGSTMWLARLVANVVSYEHNEVWYRKVEEAIKERGISNVLLVLSMGYPYGGIVLAKNEGFDFVLVDGRGRVKTIQDVVDHVMPGGMIVLDNSERSRYKEGVAMIDAKGWERLDFEVNMAHRKRPWRTTVWRRPG